MTVVLVSHGNLAGALLSTAQRIAGECPYVSALELGIDESPEGFRRRLLEALQRAEAGRPEQWLVLTDLLGGTPHRVAMMVRQDLLTPDRCVVVSGMNLAMVVDALLSCDDEADVQALARHAASSALQQIRGGLQGDEAAP